MINDSTYQPTSKRAVSLCKSAISLAASKRSTQEDINVVNTRLLEEHMQYMRPGSVEHERAKRTIEQLKAKS